METTDNLNLPYLMPSQAQKHVTHNEALRALDILVQLSVVSRGQQTPPVGPQAGARYIVPQGAGGEWTGRADNVAAWQDGAWTFHIPRNGWLAHVEDEAALFSFDDGAWKEPKFSMGPTGQLGRLRSRAFRHSFGPFGPTSRAFPATAPKTSRS